MSTATPSPKTNGDNRPGTYTEYVNRLSESDPKTALQMAMLETERAQAAARTATAAIVEFDDAGRISKANYEGLRKMASEYAASTLVPEQYRKNAANCFIALQMSQRMKIDPFAYMQNSYVVQGRPGIESKLAIAMLNQSGKIKGRIHYKIDKDQHGKILSCVACVVDADTGEEVEGEAITPQLVKDEGWLSKSGSKWKTMEGQMYRYRAAIFLIRTDYPEVLMGIQTVDELQDIGGDQGTTRTITDMTAELEALGQEMTEDAQPASESSQAVEPQDSTTIDPETEMEWEADLRESARNCTTNSDLKAWSKTWAKVDNHPGLAAVRDDAHAEALERISQ